MTKSVQQKILDEFAFLEGVVSEYYYMKIAERAMEIYSAGEEDGYTQWEAECASEQCDNDQVTWERGYNQGYKEGYLSGRDGS